jgi:hypothetical protein
MDQINYNNDNNKKPEKKTFGSSDALSNSIKNLTKPHFLGSIHMNKELLNTFSSIENLLNGDLEMKINKSLKNTLINPITKILIILMILFNIIWLLILFLL